MNLSKDITTAMKGLLILLIVLGHNHEIAPEQSLLMTWLYNFHVLIFFILPFYYENKKDKVSTSYIIDLVVRNWVPYFLTTLVVLSYEVFRLGYECLGFDTLFAFFNGSTTMTGGVLGATFLWFLPTFCSFSIIMIFTSRYKWLEYVLFIIGIACWVLTWSQFEWLKIHSLFGIPMALKCYSLGMLTRILVRESWNYVVGSIVFIVLSVLHYNEIVISYIDILWPISAFCFLLLIQNLLSNRLFLFFGKYSLLIYLVHVFIYQSLNLVLPKDALGSFLNITFTLIISGILSVYIQRISFLQKLYIPRNWNDFVTFYKR